MKIITNNKEKFVDIEYIDSIKISSKDYINELKNKKNIIILGNFDGVHKGHQLLIKEGIKKGKEIGANVIVYTFLESPQNNKNIITTPSEKAYLLNNLDVDYVYFENFESIRHMSPEEFVSKILIDKFNVSHVFCGFNFTFGKNKSGNIVTLYDLFSKKYKNIQLHVKKPVLNDNGEIISSTKIRKYLENGEYSKAKENLGHNYMILGKVQHGKKLGRTIGFPTANLPLNDRLYPSFGVYGGYVQIEGYKNIYHCVVNIGKNPTVDFKGLTVETHIYDFDEDIYGKTILVEFLEKLRSEKKMNSIEELKQEIKKDKNNWRKKIDEKYYDTDKNR